MIVLELPMEAIGNTALIVVGLAISFIAGAIVGGFSK